MILSWSSSFPGKKRNQLKNLYFVGEQIQNGSNPLDGPLMVRGEVKLIPRSYLPNAVAHHQYRLIACILYLVKVLQNSIDSMVLEPQLQPTLGR